MMEYPRYDVCIRHRCEDVPRSSDLTAPTLFLARPMTGNRDAPHEMPTRVRLRYAGYGAAVDRAESGVNSGQGDVVVVHNRVH